MTTITAAELATRVQSQGLRLQTSVAQAFLREWQRQGVVEEDNGQWHLTPAGLAMFSGWDPDEAMAGE